MADTLFRVQFDDDKYTDVCKYTRDKKGQTNAEEKRGVKEAFSGLQCKGDRVNQWEAESSKEVYRKTFKKAKECMQRRISTMKRFPARNLSGKQARIRHIYPIELAYSYGKDCLKRFATKEQQNLYRNSTNALIDEVSATNNTKNVKSYFNPTIENSIRAKRSNAAEILDKQYDYSPHNWNLINTVRSAGDNWASLSNEQRTMYLSRFYNTLAERPNVLEAIENANNENNKGPAAIETPKKRLRTLKRRAKRVPVSKPPPKVNNVFLTALEKDPEFQRRTEEEKLAFVETTKNRLIGMQKNLETLMLKRDTLNTLIRLISSQTQYDKIIIARGREALTPNERAGVAAYNELTDVMERAASQGEAFTKRIVRDFAALQTEISRYPELGPWFKLDIYDYLIYDLDTYILGLPNAEYYPLFEKANATIQTSNRINDITKSLNDSQPLKRILLILIVLKRDKAALKDTTNVKEKAKLKDAIEKYESQLATAKEELPALTALYKNRTELVAHIVNNVGTLFDNPILLRDYENKKLNDATATAARLFEIMGTMPPAPPKK
jgi:hypothetical protein